MEDRKLPKPLTEKSLKDRSVTGKPFTGKALTDKPLTGQPLTGKALPGKALTDKPLTGKALGQQGERLVADYLRQRGYALLEANFRIGRMGELDLIAKKDGRICFVEVKTRRSTRYGVPSEAVTATKQQTIIRLAQIYLSMKGLSESPVRFDVAEVYSNGDSFHIEYLENAFWA